MRTTLLFLLVLLMTSCASQKQTRISGTEINLRYAEVIAIERVKMPSAAPAGAIVGGFTGLALSQRRRPSQQIATGIGGAVLGGLAVKALEGDKLGYSYQLRYLDGSESRFITEKGYLQTGDCVVVESGAHQNLRRVASSVCTTSPGIRSPIGQHQSGAQECSEAKRELLMAQGEEAVKNAGTKVEILCHF